jgi:predicted nucleic acid-binding protein
LTGFLLDTNVVSEARRGRPDGRVVAWVDRHRGNNWLSVVTIAELCKGIAAVRRSKGEHQKAPKLQAWLDTIRQLYAERIIPLDEAMAAMAGEFMGRHQMTVEDAMIGATAKARSLILVTRNIRDFRAAGIELVDPWSGSAPTPP